MPRTLILTVAIALAMHVSPLAAQPKVIGKKGFPKAGKAKPPAPGPLANFEKLTPEERQRALNNLPPDRRKQLERRLERFKNLDPDQRDRLQARLQEYRMLPLDRQDEVRRALQRLRRLSEPDRKKRMESEEFRKRFSPAERKLLEEVLIPPQM